MPIVRNKKIEVLFSAKEIAKRNHALAEEVALSDLSDILVISVLKGSFVFAADLVRSMHKVGLSPELEFISISSYGAGQSAGKPVILRDIESNVEGRDVLLERGASKVAIVTLLDKSMRRKTKIDADYVGFECPDKFVVGYGMDSGHAFRELPFVGAIVGDA